MDLSKTRLIESVLAGRIAMSVSMRALDCPVTAPAPTPDSLQSARRRKSDSGAKPNQEAGE